VNVGSPFAFKYDMDHIGFSGLIICISGVKYMTQVQKEFVQKITSSLGGLTMALNFRVARDAAFVCFNYQTIYP
jgi:hypothetical protein